MAFANKVDGRSYAHVLGGSTAWKGAQDVGSNRVSSSRPVMKKIKKYSSIVFTNRSASIVSSSNCHRLKDGDNKVFNSSWDKAVPIENINLQNRFQVLSSLDQSLVEFEENVLSGTSTVVNNHFPKRDMEKSRFFGHSSSNDGNQAIASESVAHKKCCEQIGTKFGCIPVGEITLFNGTYTYWKEIPNIIQTHKLIRSSALPNFFGLRIPVGTSLKVGTWRHYLSDYFDQQLPDLIKFGFRLDFDRSTMLGVTEDFHPSAKNC